MDCMVSHQPTPTPTRTPSGTPTDFPTPSPSPSPTTTTYPTTMPTPSPTEMPTIYCPCITINSTQTSAFTGTYIVTGVSRNEHYHWLEQMQTGKEIYWMYQSR